LQKAEVPRLRLQPFLDSFLDGSSLESSWNEGIDEHQIPASVEQQ
jgi:hypothetical protein